MARPGLKSLGAACLAGSALFIASCSLSAPSPAGGFHHDFTPRTIGPGLMTTRLLATRDTYMMDRIQDGVLLGQTIGMARGSQWDVAAETRSLAISNHDTAANATDIEVDGYYLGAQYKSPFPKAGKETVLLSYFAGGGLGAFGDYVKHADAHAGVTGGYNGKYLCPFLATAAGFSLPYARKSFSYAGGNVFAGRVGAVERYRYATAAWLVMEGGLESPFGNREKGLRLHMSFGYQAFHMFESDIVSDRVGSTVLQGLDFQSKLGLSWTY